MSILPYRLTKPCKNKTCGLLWDREGGVGPELYGPRCPDCRKMHKDYPDLKVRVCMACGRQYLSIRPIDRVCPPCREGNREYAYASGGSAAPSSRGSAGWRAWADDHPQSAEAPAGPESPGLHDQEQGQTAQNPPDAIHALGGPLT